MKRITITESQYKRLLLSEQVKNPSYYCIKKDYSTKGKEVKLPNGVSFKILNKNIDALYFVEDGTFYHIKDGKGWKKSGKYDCGTNEYSVGKSKGKLYDYINNFLSQKSKPSKISDILSSEKEKKDENNCWDGTTLASVVKFMKLKDWGKPTSSDKDGCQACYRKEEGSFNINMCFKSNRYYTLSIESRIPVSYDTKASIIKLHPPLKDKKFNKIIYDGVWYTSSSLGDSKSALQIINMKLDLRELHIGNDYSQKIKSESRYPFRKVIEAIVDTINQPTQEEKQAAGVSVVHLEHYNKLLDNLDEISVSRDQMKDALKYINTNFKSFDEWNKFNTSIEEWGKKTPIEFINDVSFWFASEYNEGLKKELINILEGESSWDNLSNTIKKIIEYL